jgi:hypothetical protein
LTTLQVLVLGAGLRDLGAVLRDFVVVCVAIAFNEFKRFEPRETIVG